MKIKKYLVFLILTFSLLYVVNGINPDKTHEAAKQSVIAYAENGVGE
ncbi:hypothetical protein ABNB59_19855 [Paenibacillus larvae]|uniref:Uncharacterized protein n=2 Tax=Paenibacillus larvae TaxID=1464 RepID=A0A6C0QNM0_9BACL|nr:hypothetical protein [Paenibacillus larvae]AVF23670.1 hypothetical protein ERICI_03937 [Paenibacillus larvae subsp. larvae]AVG13875.1 hypothetical protein ERICII_03580 [Paenibacillus larvae subsp. larvae DSM 25430]ETK29660.1 hypothetical protein ERIC1_1c32170 [Paenibacillus larvae subsp. larvae DSM 25719]MCY7478552.1 hypothetical protein [Paenibacillus larvae]MCY7491850.1 hypothetical protein [Paenibacillus larvae]